jgi:hypothetical protein
MRLAKTRPICASKPATHVMSTVLMMSVWEVMADNVAVGRVV